METDALRETDRGSHQNPRTVRIQIIPKTMADQRHGLDLVHVGVTEEVCCPETLE